MADRDGDLELSHLSYYTDSSILTSNPRARSDREGSTNNASSSRDATILGTERRSAPFLPQQANGLAPSVLHRVLNENRKASTCASSRSAIGQNSLSTVENTISNTGVGVDDRSLNFAQVVRQTAVAPSALEQERQDKIKACLEVTKKVQPSLDSLREWSAVREEEKLAAMKEISVRESLRRQIKKLSRSELPSDNRLLELVHHYHPPRGEVPIYVCDFGDGRASHFATTLGNIEECWREKPDWVTVRWIHAPVGVGLTHSSIEDLFRHDGSKPWAFTNVAGPTWPYIVCQTISLENRDAYKARRDTCILASKVERLASKLDHTKFRGDNNGRLQGDIAWRAQHVGSTMGFLDLAQSDIGYQLPDGRGLGLNGPHGGIRPTDTNLDEQILRRFPFFKLTQIVRAPFRCFHRPDGVLLTMSAMRGVNYIDRRLSEHLQEPPEFLFGNPDASVLAQVWKLFSESGTKSWHRASVEWFTVYLVTELVCTPHTISQGHNAPTIQSAYQSIIQDFKRRRFDEWQRGDSIKLVRDYILCVDELTILVHLMSKQLDFLYRLKKDCDRLNVDSTDVKTPQGKDAVDRCNWAIGVLEENFTVLENLLKDLRSSMLALFQLRSIEQNELAISADSQNRAILLFTGVTIIFLPLSFFASYFGMNLKGIINTERNQQYFWKVCGSIAIVIIVVTMLYAFRGYLLGPIIRVKDFEADLECVVRSISANVQDALSRTRAPVGIDQDWIVSHVREQYQSDDQVISDNDADACDNARFNHEQGLSGIARLPLKLRNLILSIPIAAGSVEITRASKALAEETAELLAKHGACRLNIGYDGTRAEPKYRTVVPTPSMAQKIQNVHIVVNMAPLRNIGPRIQCLTDFAGPRLHRRLCRMVFMCFPHQHEMVSRELLEVDRRYTEFERIMLKIEVYNEAQLEYTMSDFHCGRLLLNKDHTIMIEKETLARASGEVPFGKEGANDTMTYYPWKSVGEDKISEDGGPEESDATGEGNFREDGDGNEDEQ